MWQNPVNGTSRVEIQHDSGDLALHRTKNITIAGQSIDDFKCRLRILTLNDVNVMKQNASERLKPQSMFDMLIIA